MVPYRTIKERSHTHMVLLPHTLAIRDSTSRETLVECVKVPVYRELGEDWLQCAYVRALATLLRRNDSLTKTDANGHAFPNINAYNVYSCNLLQFDCSHQWGHQLRS